MKSCGAILIKVTAIQEETSLEASCPSNDPTSPYRSSAERQSKKSCDKRYSFLIAPLTLLVFVLLFLYCQPAEEERSAEITTTEGSSKQISITHTEKVIRTTDAPTIVEEKEENLDLKNVSEPSEGYPPQNRSCEPEETLHRFCADTVFVLVAKCEEDEKCCSCDKTEICLPFRFEVRDKNASVVIRNGDFTVTRTVRVVDHMECHCRNRSGQHDELTLAETVKCNDL